MKFPRPSPSMFAYCKQSKTGVVEGLGTRLAISLLHELTTAKSHNYMYSLAPLTSAAARWLCLLQLLLLIASAAAAAPWLHQETYFCLIVYMDWYCYYSTKHSYCSLSTSIKSKVNFSFVWMFVYSVTALAAELPLYHLLWCIHLYPIAWVVQKCCRHVYQRTR